VPWRPRLLTELELAAEKMAFVEATLRLPVHRNGAAVQRRRTSHSRRWQPSTVPGRISEACAKASRSCKRPLLLLL